MQIQNGAMKLLLVLSAALLIMPKTSLFADFRGISWGASVETVKASEEAYLVSATEEKLVYKTTLLDCTVSVTYEFIADECVRASYDFRTYENQPDAIVKTILAIAEMLNQKYGDSENTKKGISLIPPSFADDPATWGAALQMGYMSLSDKWETPTEQISLMAIGLSERIHSIIAYTPHTVSENVTAAIAEEKAAEAAEEARKMAEAFEQL